MPPLTCLPHVLPGTCTGVSKLWLVNCPLHCAYHSTLFHPAQGTPLGHLRPAKARACLLDFGQSTVPPGFWALTKR